MRYLMLFNEYLRGISDYSEWSHIYDLLMQIDSWNDCIEELEFRLDILKETNIALPVLNWFCPSYPWGLDYRSVGWFESRVRKFKNDLEWLYGIRVDAFKSELKQEYGISVDASMECSEEPEEIIDGQISIEDYVFSLNPVFRLSRPDLIEVHP